jgi:hypothetical protein
MTNEGASGPAFPSLSWEQVRVLQYVAEKSALPTYDDPDDNAPDPVDWLAQIDAPYRRRARFFNRFAACFAQLGAMPGELRLSIEPLHPLPDGDRTAWLSSQLASLGVSDQKENPGLGILSRALFTSYHPGAGLFDLADAPPTHPDLFLFDPLVGFVLWRDNGQVRNFWLGNQRDIIGLQQASAPLKEILLQSDSEHFCIGKSLLMRLVSPFMKQRRDVVFDDADIPVVQVETQRDLEALADDLRNACHNAPANVSAVFRGQTSEYLLPDRRALVAAGVCLYSDVRDHSVVPSLYRHYDRFVNDPAHFRAFAAHLLDWHFYSDLMFGDPAKYVTVDGQPYKPKEAPSDTTATMQLFMAGSSGQKRAFEDTGPATLWTITDSDGVVLDRYVKLHRPGHDNVRRNLILQHYGAPTPFIDVTHDIRVAEWFALNRVDVEEDGLSTSGMVGQPFREPAIFVFLVLDGLTPIVDTEALTTPDEALRPHRQACAVLGGAGNLYRNAASRFIALKIKFADGFQPAGLPTARHLFPGPDEDAMLKRLLGCYEAPRDLSKTFPVYWFPPEGRSGGLKPPPTARPKSAPPAP